MKTKILLIRHGEVENPDNIEYMRLPGFGLSKTGTRQAKELKKVLDNKKISVIYSSPLDRAKQTAQIISGNKIPIVYSDSLIEANYKKWEGLSRDKRPKDELEGYIKDPAKYSAVLGESLSCIQKRVVETIFEAIENNQGKTIAFVFHADPIITARLFFEGRPVDDLMKIDLKHASVTSIVFDNKLKCEKVDYREYVKAKDWRK